MAIAALAACSPAGADASSEVAGAPPTSPGEALVTKYTWAGPGQEAQQGPFAPRDECGEIDGAYAFRIALADATLKRDTEAFVALAAPDIKLDFGGGEGRGELRERLQAPEWQLWDALEGLLPLGCAINEQGELILPWHFAKGLDGRDVFTAMLVTGNDVPMLADPREGSEVVTRLSWDVVDLDPELFDGELGPYARVLTKDGKSGWIAEDSLRSEIDYRIVAAMGADGRRMTAFIAGD